MKLYRPCINFYIKSFSANTNTVVVGFWKWIVECSTTLSFINFIGNINRWKVRKSQRNLTYIMNDSEENVRMFVCGFYQQIHLQHQLNLCCLEYSCEYAPILEHAVSCLPYLTQSMFLCAWKLKRCLHCICGLWK